jgi:hypothetical protein
MQVSRHVEKWQRLTKRPKSSFGRNALYPSRVIVLSTRLPRLTFRVSHVSLVCVRSLFHSSVRVLTDIYRPITLCCRTI